MPPVSAPEIRSQAFPRWRPAGLADLPAISRVAGAVHADFPERDEVFADKLAFFPPGCFLAEDGAGPLGYLLAHPWVFGAAPTLDRLLAPRGAPDVFYIHDLALLERARGLGLGVRGAALAEAAARTAGLARMALVAVSGSAPFWEGRGFRRVAPAPATLAGYGGAAAYMARALS